MPNKKIFKRLIPLYIFALFLLTIQLVTHLNRSCVNMYVDFGSLDHNKKISTCIDVNGKTGAEFVFYNAGIKLAGTEKYGAQIVCRVNGLPDSTREKCLTMPPENAYWAVIVKQRRGMMDKWGWAQTGISEVYLNPGDSIGLVFTENGKMRWPN